MNSPAETPVARRFGPIRYATAGRFELPRLADTTEPEAEGQLCPQPRQKLTEAAGLPADALVHGEDCLYLSIATPDRDGGSRPVMVFIHGGGFVTGGGLLDWYDGSKLAVEHDVVVVSLNYRLGVFGYLVLDGVCEGNLGLHDQIAALNWVKTNIAAYGGDPTNVTVFGQSAGAHSIRLLLEIPAVRGLFAGAIMQSGPAGQLSRPIDRAAEIGQRFAANLEGDPLTASVPELLDAQRRTARERARPGRLVTSPFAPVVGSQLIPKAGVHLHSNVSGLHVICGWNADDVSGFTGPQEHVDALTDRMFGDPLTSFRDELRSAGARANTYRMNWRPSGSAYGATHCLELPLLLGTRQSWEYAPMLGDASWDEVQSLGREMRAIWATFARTGSVDSAIAKRLPLTWNP